MSYTPFPSSSHLHRAKRTKISDACDACRKRKSRCELITKEGCHRCRVLSTPCTLASASPDDYSSSTPPEAAGDGIRSSAQESYGQLHLLRTIEERTKRIEQRLIMLSPGGIPSSAFDGVSRVNHREGDVKGAFEMMICGVQLFRSFIPPSPVEAGLATVEELSQSWERCKTIISQSISPPPSLTLSLPYDNFTQLVVLLYGSGQARQNQLYAIVTRIIQARKLQASPQVLFGLLLLSVLPCCSPSLSTSPDPLGATAYMKDMASGMGLDDSIHRLFLEDPVDWVFHTGALQNAFLWYSIQHRVIYSEMLNSPSFAFRPFSTPLLIGTQLSNQTDDHWRHLTLESRLISIVEPFGYHLQAIRSAREFTTERMGLFDSALRLIREQLEAWRIDVEQSGLPSAQWLHLFSLLLEALLHLKGSCDASSLQPSPLGFEARWPIIPRMGANIMRSSESAIAYVIDEKVQLSSLPSQILTMSILPYAASYSSRSLGQIDPYEALPTLRSYRDVLLASHPSMSDLLKRIDSAIPDAQWREVNESSRELEAYNLDLSMDWTFLAGLMEPGMHSAGEATNGNWMLDSIFQ